MSHLPQNLFCLLVDQWVADTAQNQGGTNGKRKDKATRPVFGDGLEALHGECGEIWLRAWFAGQKVQG